MGVVDAAAEIKVPDHRRPFQFSLFSLLVVTTSVAMREKEAAERTANHVKK